MPVNDAPVGGVVTDLAVAEDSGSSSLGLGAVSYGPGGGADEAGQGLAFTVTALPPAGFGRITLAELVEPRRKAFAKLDLDQDGKLSFEEWAVKTIDKFKTADADKNGGLTRAEYATTAPKPKPKKAVCACPTANESDD